MLAITAASAAAQYQGQKNQAAAQANQNAQQTALINQDRINKYSAAQQQQDLVNQEAYQKLDQNGQATRSALATAMTSAGEAGVSGTSVSALQQEYLSRQGDYANDVENNRVASDERLTQQMQGFDVQAQSAINSERQPVQPSMLGMGLQIAGGAANAYSNYAYFNSRNPSPGGGEAPAGMWNGGTATGKNGMRGGGV